MVYLPEGPEYCHEIIDTSYVLRFVAVGVHVHVGNELTPFQSVSATNYKMIMNQCILMAIMPMGRVTRRCTYGQTPVSHF